MSYRIAYDPSRRDKFYTSKSRRVARWLIPAILAAGCITVFGDPIMSLLLPGDPQVTSSALNELTDNLRAGDSFQEAIAAFCSYIIENAH